MQWPKSHDTNLCQTSIVSNRNTRTLLIFEEAQQLAAQHGVVALPRADRRLLAASLQLLLALEHALHVGGQVAARHAVLLLEAVRVLARLQTQRSLPLLFLLRVSALYLLDLRVLPGV